ncbi:hypothetical protein [Streptomyces sp. NPDC048111]|uniref:hypothetical protein n=1 Tax=Streptomyces sp. NPDC048111 TaxID=3365500 RepID=UPI00371190E3
MRISRKRATVGATLATSVALMVGTVAPHAYADGTDSTSTTRAAAAVDSVAAAFDSHHAEAIGSGTVHVGVPATAAGSVTVTSPGHPLVGFSLPQMKNVTGVTTASGTVFYPDAAPSADIAVQPTRAGARALVNIKSAAAAHDYRYDLTLPKGATLTPEDDGGVLIQAADGAVIGEVATPWARDAAGKPVATQYRVEGQRLIQHVAFTEASAFPVVADPNLSGAAKAVVKLITKIPGWAKAAHGSYQSFEKWVGKQNWALKVAWWGVKGELGYKIWEYLNHL